MKYSAKAFLCAVFFFNFVGKTIAQPVLTYENSGPIVGTNYQVLIGDSMNPGPAGQDQTWDFSAFVATDTMTFHYVQEDMDSIAGCAMEHPYDVAGGHYASAADHASIMRSLYMFFPDGSTPFYIENHRVLEFPMGFGGMFDNQRVFFMFYNTPCDTIRFQSPEHIEADAYGTVTLPFGTFGPVLRVHLTGADIWETDLADEAYRYYLPGLRYPLVTVARKFLDASDIWHTLIIDPAFVGISSLPSLDPDVRIYPVPARDRIYLQGGIGIQRYQDLVVIDAQGREVKRFARMDPSAGLDVHELAPGLYSLCAGRSGQRSSLGRFIKEPE